MEKGDLPRHGEGFCVIVEQIANDCVEIVSPNHPGRTIWEARVGRHENEARLVSCLADNLGSMFDEVWSWFLEESFSKFGQGGISKWGMNFLLLYKMVDDSTFSFRQKWWTALDNAFWTFLDNHRGVRWGPKIFSRTDSDTDPYWA